MSLNNDLLCSVGEKTLDPLQKLALNAIVVQLDEEMMVGHLVERRFVVQRGWYLYVFHSQAWLPGHLWSESGAFSHSFCLQKSCWASAKTSSWSRWPVIEWTMGFIIFPQMEVSEMGAVVGQCTTFSMLVELMCVFMLKALLPLQVISY